MILYFIRKTVVTLCLNLLVFFLGLFALPEIANEFIPAIEIPAVAVVFPTTLLGTESVTKNLVAPVERLLLKSGDVERVETTLEPGRAITLIYYKWTLKPEECLLKARQVVGGVERPAGTLAPIFVLHRPTLSPILRVVLHGDSLDKLTATGQLAAREIERVKGVSEVRLNGASPRIGMIKVNPETLTARKLTLQSILASAAGTWSFRHLFRTQSLDQTPQRLEVKLDSTADLREMPVEGPGGNTVKLANAAEIIDGTKPPEVFFGKGEASVILEVLKSPGADALSVVDAAHKIIEENVHRNSKLEVTDIYDEAEKIRAAQEGVFHNFREGIILNTLILIFFLGSIQGCIIATAVFPTAIFGALIAMKVLGISFNIFSLNGFSLAVGMIADAATVLLDSIDHRLKHGSELEEACWKGTEDVARGVFTGVLTSCAVLFPICFQTGISSKLFGDLAMTLIAANLMCLIAVYTLTPWMASKLLSKNEKPPIAPVAWLFGISTKLVDFVVRVAISTFDRSVRSPRFRVLMPVTVSSICLASLLFVPPSELLPEVKSNIYSITVPMNRNELKANGDAHQRKISAALGSEPTIEWALTTRDADTLSATLKTKAKAPVQPILERLALSMGLPLKRVLSFPLGPTPPTEPMNYNGFFYLSKSIAPNKRKELADQFCKLQGILDCTGVDHYASPGMILKDLPLNLARSGVSPIEVVTEAGLNIHEVDVANLGNLPFSTPVLLQVDTKNSVSDIPYLIGKKHETVSKVGSFFLTSMERKVASAFRADLNDYEPLYFRLGKLTLGQAVGEMEKLQDAMGIPKFDVLGMGGIRNMADTFSKMMVALGLAALLVFAVLFLQFQSVVQAVIIMLSIPQALGGAIFGLLVMHETMNAGVMVGFVLLIGIIVSSGIYLMEALNHELARGSTLTHAIHEAITRRVRPILMTKFSCIFGMLPILVFESEGQELYRGMAIVNIFGLITGTVLTLGVAPILIKKFVGWEKKLAN